MRGKPRDSLQSHGASSSRGTTVRFVPDAQIFSDTRLDARKIGRRLRELAWLHPPVQFTRTDQRSQVFQAPQGIASCWPQLCGRSEAAYGPLHATGVAEEIDVSVLAVWRKAAQQHSIESFANSERTTEHGTHVSGFMRGLARAVRSALPEERRELPKQRIRKRITRGWHALVCVRLIDPKYDHPTRQRLRTERATAAVRAVTEPAMLTLLDSNAELRIHLREALRTDQ